MRNLLVSFVTLALLLGGCQNQATPEAIAYDTLLQAANVLDAKHALFEIEVAKGRVTTAKEREIRQSYIAAKNAIINASIVAESGLDAKTPEEVSRLVKATVALITEILPPPTP